MADFGLVRGFGIDNHELDGLTPWMCFVLGYELAIFDERIDQRKPFSQMIHSENRERIETRCKEEGVQYTISWMEGDVSESWLIIQVSDYQKARVS
jgi:hypothetical protein